jgi:hypothetical protein
MPKLLKRYRWGIALGLLLAALVVNLFFTSRPLMPHSVVQVEEIATLPDTFALERLRRNAQRGSGFIEHPRPAASWIDWRTTPLKIGWVYKEKGFLGMPFYAENISFGPSLYIDTGQGYSIVGVDAGDIALIEQELGSQAVTSYSFAWWKHAWGWLFPPLLILILWRWIVTRMNREEEEHEFIPAEIFE